MGAACSSESHNATVNGSIPNTSTQHELEVIYFDAKGRAEPTRLVFAVGGIPFKDTRVSYQEFGTLVASGALPLETLPVLKLDGKIVSVQSMAMLRFAAEVAHLQVQPQDILFSEEILSTTLDMRCFGEVWFNASDDDKKRHAKEIVDTGFLHYAKHMESLLATSRATSKKGHSGPFIAQSMTFVDLFVFSTVEAVKGIVGTVGATLPLNEVPLLAALLDAVAELPAVKSSK